MAEDTHRLEAELVTRKHMQRVNTLLLMLAQDLITRAHTHDQSKLTEMELGPLTEMQRIIAREGQAAFGTPEYDRRKALLGPMLDHHYRHNRHHPEHFGDAGVEGMTLLDLVEMFVDWKAASERGEEQHMSLTSAANRYGFSGQLMQIFCNTARELNWPYR